MGKHWQEVADYVVQADVTKNRSAGDKRPAGLDSTTIHAAELLAASCGMLTNGSTSWFSLRYWAAS